MEARRKALVEGRMKDLARLQEYGLPPRFFHNDLHDLESLWWVAVWKLFNNGAKSEASLTSIDLRERVKQRQLARNSLFPPSDETLKRTLFLQTNVHYWDYLAWLRWDTLKGALNNARTVLLDKYAKFEAGFPDIQLQFFDGAHSQLYSLFQECKICIGEEKLRTSREPDWNRLSVGTEITHATTATHILEPGALQRPSERKGKRKTYHQPSTVGRGESCFPKVDKRKYDGVDDVSPTRPACKVRF